MKYNSVFLYGKIKDITISPVSVFEIETIKGNRPCGNTKAQYKHDIITVITEEDHLINEMMHWNVGDMVEVKGVLVSEKIPFTTECPHCKAELTKECIFTYVKPVYLSKIEAGNSRKEINSLLNKRKEISNQITIAGTLSTPVQPYLGKDNCPAAIYHIKTEKNNRYFPEEKELDSFLVRSYGKNSEQDAKYLEKGSLVLIDGALQSINSKHSTTCEQCGKTFKWTSFPVEIVPYNCEYISSDTKLRKEG